jgi:Xaa-Pro aminopeptidase
MTSTSQLKPQVHTPQVKDKFTQLRALMTSLNLDGYLIPSADEHLNEYLPEAWQRRDWISDFTGSAGDLLVGIDQAWLFVDSRYHEQADLQVDSSAIQVCKLGLEGHKTLEETLESLGQAKSGFRLGFDPFTLAVGQFQQLQKKLEPIGSRLVFVMENLVDKIRLESPWRELDPIPAIASSQVFSLPDTITGASVKQKLEKVREKIKQANSEILPITKLDQIAWLFNLRGWDIPYNPVFIAYAIATQTQAFLFSNLDRIEAEIQQNLQASGVTLLPYQEYEATLKALVSASNNLRVLIDPRHTTMGTYCLLEGVQAIETANPIEGMKARKNKIEIEQMKAANLKASRAKTRTLKWISEQIDSGKQISELDVANAIAQNYQQESDFQGLSFNTIAGAGSNSAIVHYGTPTANRLLQTGELFLLDSGAQYLGGTTDATRTIIVGEPTESQILRYTEVLKAHINCAMQQFPKGTTGTQLDGITRYTLWQEKLDFGHGTGHGVGAFLNVHEGPNGISKRANVPLEPSMVTSIEPGFYESNWGGIRIENLYIVVELPDKKEENETPWYRFEPLAYIPFEKKLIDLNRLNSRQREWLDWYNAKIVEKLTPSLESDDARWLKQVCSF